jgi:predicted glycoside hydrolase/deacetylase ChbG (UPF0249 family)
VKNHKLFKRLIINADDFGLSAGINRAIIEGYRKGVIKSASIMPNAGFFDDALGLLKANPGLDVGVHLTLVEEKPVLPVETVPSLINKKKCFYKNHRTFLLNLILGRIDRNQIKRELSAQIDKCLSANLRLTHIDSHQFIHCFPFIFDIVIELARKYRIPFVRIPNKRIRLSDFKSSRSIHQLIFNIMSFIYRLKLKNFRISAVPQMFGFIESGRINEENFDNIIKFFGPGVAEFICHPGITDKELFGKYGHWKYNWQKEYEFIVLRAYEIIKRHNVEIISFRELKELNEASL